MRGVAILPVKVKAGMEGTVCIFRPKLTQSNVVNSTVNLGFEAIKPSYEICKL